MDDPQHDKTSRHRTPHGFGDDSRSRFLRQRPDGQALRWLQRVRGAEVVGVRALRGGSSSAVHAVRLETASGRDTVILRRYVLDQLNAEEPDIADREARVLRLLESCHAQTPELLALDPTGEEAGCPTLVMSRVPGRLDWNPADIDRWLRELAGVLPLVHATPIRADAQVQAFRPYRPESWNPPGWMRDPGLWERALDVFHGPRLDADLVFIHRDFHPGNVLWRRGRVSGVVDWQVASIGPRSADVFWCRSNLIGRFGIAVADRFVNVWEQVSGEEYHPWAETVMLVDVLDGARRRRDAPQVLHALEDVLARRLAQLGA